jgi:putative oxidoreductase
MVSEQLDPLSKFSTVPLRIALAVPMVIHGLGKLGIGPAGPGSIDAFAGFLGSLGVPAAGIFAVIVTAVEVGGGLAVLLGVATRYAAALIAIDMLVATLVVHVPNGYLVADGGIELSSTLMLLAVALVLTGAGPLSLERAVLGEEL